MIVVGSPNLISKCSLPLTAQDLAEFTLLNDGQAIWTTLLGDHQAWAELHINQAALVIEAAMSGQGLAMANRVFLEDALSSGRLVQVVDNIVATRLLSGSSEEDAR
ncbi:Glycine cleavage system transcriptional activator [compost metagenome]